MKLLLEPSFPAQQSAILQTPFVSTQRWSDPNATDEDLVAAAVTTGSTAVVFLGRQALGRPEVMRRARAEHVSVIATETSNPLDAIDYLHDNLGRLHRELAEGTRALLVQRDRLVEVGLDEF